MMKNHFDHKIFSHVAQCVDYESDDMENLYKIQFKLFPVFFFSSFYLSSIEKFTGTSFESCNDLISKSCSHGKYRHRVCW